MKVGLVGFGRTGRSVASITLENPDICLEWVVRKSTRLEHRSVPEFLGIESHEPGLIYSKDEYSAAELLRRLPVDAIMDFSSQSGLDWYGEAAADAGVAIITAISKYDDEDEIVRRLRSYAERTRVLWSPNITVGINFLMLAARALKEIAPHTDVEIVEEHFKDKPEVSGTALRIAATLGIEHDDVKTIRAGGIIGTHEILFGFPFQTVRLKHESISREAFGNGAMFAVRHLLELPNGYYRMEDLMAPYFSGINTEQSA
ncbi:MAG: 4-hydroxy-tetrahydrodipicolinate reductase [Ilumatobacteraceae bacterium]